MIMKSNASLLFISAAILLCGCASKPATKAVSQTRAGLTDAALSPLEDLNLRKDEVPAVLASIRNPYNVDKEMACSDIEAEIKALDTVLPPDWDVLTEEEQTSLSDRAADTASDGVLGVVASEARELIPYRGWVRRLSGANSHDRKLRAAFDRGAARRTYLKAIGRTKGCGGIPPPVFADERSPQVDYRGDAPSTRKTPPDTSGPLDLRQPAPSGATTSSQPNAD
ncbi:hypothetical protein [Henriciella marina]|uniref:hypothetical protein n=1 Tax=Henriciella marina TaxID=453851 RepID=UPI0012EAFF2F|nr:hypothetical protein [Henriciella marina]